MTYDGTESGTDPRIADFFAHLDRKAQTGGPPPAPFGAWADLRAALAGLNQDALTGVFDGVEATFNIDVSDERYERWSLPKRAEANRNAAGALRAALAAGGVATVEQIRAIQAYTGFGGFKKIGVLPPEYPDAFVAASKEWENVGVGGVVSEQTAAIMERVKDQYFTGLDVCRAAHQLVARVLPTAKRYLEPSVGIGRFLRTAPPGLSWTVCELDGFMADMVRVMYPTAEHHQGYFEVFARTARKTPRFDVVIGNPPYGKRPGEMRALDLDGVTTAEDYFNLAGASALVPGGVLCYVVPLSTLTRDKSTEARTRMLQGCAFRGAAILPSGTFPNVTDGTFAITVWTRRARTIAPAAFDAREKKIAAGGYLGLDEARTATCGGEWRKGFRGEYLHGKPDFSKLGSIWLSPPPADVAVVRPVEPSTQAEPGTPEPEVPTVEEIQTAGNAAQVEAGKQVAAWILSISRNPAAAEEQRNAIRTLVVETIAQHGNPHPRGPAGLRAVVNREGGLEPVLLEPVGNRVASHTPPPADAAPSVIVDFWCEARGYADLGDFPAGTEIETVLADPEVYLDLRPEGPAFFSRWAYFTGNPAGLLAACDRMLARAETFGVVRDRVMAQKAQVLQHWTGSKTLGEMDVTPRSPFVPVEALQDWINSVMQKAHPEAAFEFKVENGIMSMVHNETYIRAARNKWEDLEPVYWLVAYYNRAREVERVEDAARIIQVYGKKDAKAVAQVDEDYCGKFREWVAESTWVNAIETEYNTRFAPPNMSAIPTTPVPLAGQNPGVVLHPHQNQAIRRCTLGGRARPMLFALDVGGGKCRRGASVSLTDRGLAPMKALFDAAAVEAGLDPDAVDEPGTERVIPARGLKVLSFVGKAREPRWTPVRNLFRQRLASAERTLVVRTQRGTADEVTAAHPFPVVRNGAPVWVQAADLLPGDDLVVPRGIPSLDGASAAAVPPDDLVEIMGWLLGDGCEAEAAAILTQKDPAVLEHVLGLLHARYGAGTTAAGKPWARVEFPEDGVHVPFLQIRIPAFKADMLRWDFPWGTKSGERRLPSWAVAAPERTLRILLRSYFDADAYPSPEKAMVEASTASERLATEVRYALLRFGIRATRAVKHKAATNVAEPVLRPYQYLTFYGEDVARFRDNVGFGLERKQQVLDATTDRAPNANVGVPVAAILEDLAECGISMRMLTGFPRGSGFKSANIGTVTQMADALERRLSPEGAAAMAATTMGRTKLALLEANRALATSALDRLRRFEAMDVHVRYERVESITPGEVGGYVYDFEVDAEDYDDQNYVAGDGAFLMHNTLTGSATALRWRQQGAAQRILITVPNGVMAKWLDDGKKLAPNAKVGLIGISERPGKAPIEDTPDMRMEKWLRFAAGAYDYAIVGHQTFLRDLEPDMEAAQDVASKVMWLNRGKAEEITKLQRVTLRLQEYETKLAAAQAADTRAAWGLIQSRGKGTWEEQRRNAILTLTTNVANARATIADLKEKLGATDREIADTQQAIRDWMRQKPYRPSAGAADEDDEDVVNGGDAAEGDEEIEDPHAVEGEDGPAPAPKAKVKHNPLPGLVLWSQVGVDALVVDEAHQFKNLWFPAPPAIEYAGKGEDEPFKTKRAWDMFIKTRILHRQAGGVGGVFFLTATPMTNSPLELYSLMDMCNPQAFENAGIYDKQQFIDRYWDVQPQDVPRADGTLQPAPALRGFKALDEMLGVIAGSFDRISTADLIRKGWVRALPKAEPEKLTFDRDPIQLMLIRNLTSLYVGWIKALNKKEEDDKGYRQTSACGLEQMVDPVIWSYNGGQLVPKMATLKDGTAVKVRAGAWNAPEVMIPSEDNPGARMAQGAFRLIWSGMLDKIATDPRLLQVYFDKKVQEADGMFQRYKEWTAYRNARNTWEEQGKRGPKPEKPKSKPVKAKEAVKLAITKAILPYLNLDQVQAYYDKRPVVAKIQELARRVAENVEQWSVRIHASPRTVAGIGIERLTITGDPDDPTTTLVGQPGYIKEAVDILRASGVKYDAPRILGRCGHVVFCDALPLYRQIQQAIVEATGGKIPLGRIKILPKEKAQRLAASKAFNGADATSIEPEVPPAYDVIIGSTKLMGEGIDLQRRSCAVHHIDLPWTPADLHQRNGRAVRQGNTMGRVDVIYYLTAKSYDAVRFDKIAKKGLWWEAMFSGQAATSNPSASDPAADLDEIILGMVIEDPEILENCLRQMREEREAKRVIEERTGANREWVAINASFARVRATADAQKRTALLGVAMRKLQSGLITRRAYFPEAAAALTPERVVMLDVSTGRYFPDGAFITYQNYGERHRAKIVKINVRDKDFTALYRVMGSMEIQSAGSETLFDDYLDTQMGEPWVFEEEKPKLIRAILESAQGPRWLAKPPADLADRVTDLWREATAAFAQNPRQIVRWNLSPPSFADKTPVMVLPGGRIGLFRTGISESRDATWDMTPLLSNPKFVVERMIPLDDPEARPALLSALREDRLWICSTPNVYARRIQGMRQGRLPLNTWKRVLSTLVEGPNATASVDAALKQRAARTGEKAETTEGSTPAALEL